MKRVEPGQMVLAALICIALGIIGADVWRLFFSGIQERWTIHELTGGLFATLPFIAATLMLPLALLKRVAEARRATVGMFVAILVVSLLWWALGASSPSGFSLGQVVFVRLCRFVLMPAFYAVALYVPSVTRYLDPADRRSTMEQ